MKKFSLTLVLAGVVRILFAQIPNAGFELWDSQPVPLFWETNSHPLTSPPYDPYIVKQDTERYAGNYAANFWANGYFKAYAKTTFPVSNHPLSLSLHYKSSFPPCVNDHGFPQKDTVSVLVEILNGTAIVDSGYWESITTSFSFSQLIIPISQNASVFDSCRITIWGGKIFGGCGIIAASTAFKVDQLELQYPPACSNMGIVVHGVSCLLIDTGSGNLLLPCNGTLSSLGYSAGDTIHFSFVPNPGCITFCLQGTGIDITCLDTSNRIICNVNVSMTVLQPTSYVASNGSIRSVVTGALPPIFYNWSNGPVGPGLDSIGSLPEGNYCVTVSDANGCTASICDSLHGPHICIDSALICPPGSLCCDAPLVDPVCGCDGITYTNGCIATMWNGVTSFTSGACFIQTGGECRAGFYFTRHIDTVTFHNTSSAAIINSYSWDFDDGDTSQQKDPVHVFMADTGYIVCLSITGQDSAGNHCSDRFCDTITVNHNCIDSSLLCGFPLCCDFAPMIAVCGCDSVTYINACTAEGFYGVSRYTTGACPTTGLKRFSEAENGLFISPVPAAGRLNVTYIMNSAGNTEIKITNLLGEKMKIISRGIEIPGTYKLEVDLNNLTGGIYFLEVKNEFERKLRMFVKE